MKRVAIVVFSSNTSLCGAFNANVIKMMMQTIGEFRTLGQDNILIFPIDGKWPGGRAGHACGADGKRRTLPSYGGATEPQCPVATQRERIT